MKLGILFISGFLSAAMTAFPLSAMAADSECVASNATHALYSGDNPAQVDAIFRDMHLEARHAVDHADKLHLFARNSNLTWESDVSQLQPIKEEINEMGGQVCRLEAMRAEVAPRQQAEIDRIATTIRLMADHAEDAISFGNSHRQGLWLAPYRRYADNLYHESELLARTLRY